MMETISAIYVEDDEHEALIMRIGMRRHGVSIVHVAYVTPQTVHILREPPYDTGAAVIFDAVLGGYNGLELAESLRQSGDTRPIALVTAGDAPDAQRLAALDVRFFRKPVDFAGLAATLRG